MSVAGLDHPSGNDDGRLTGRVVRQGRAPPSAITGVSVHAYRAPCDAVHVLEGSSTIVGFWMRVLVRLVFGASVGPRAASVTFVVSGQAA